jgi:UDP-glucose 4-epimerase
MGKVSLVTGAAGFIGSHIVDRLIADGHRVIGVDNFATGRLENIAHLRDQRQFEFIQADICDFNAMDAAMRGVDWVFHIAGIGDIVPSIESPLEYHSANVDGTINCLGASRGNGVKRFLYAASSTCYGLATQYPTPESHPIQTEYPYALTKYMGEELVLHWGQVYGLSVASLRMFNVYGPRSRTTGSYGAVFGVFLAQKLVGDAMTVVGDGEQTRDFTYVSDIADAFFTVASSELAGEAVNVGSGGTYSINRLVELLGGEKTNIPKRPGEPDQTFADVSRIEAATGWRAQVSFEEGVAQMLTHIENWRDAPVWTPDTIAEATTGWFKYLSK